MGKLRYGKWDTKKLTCNSAWELNFLSVCNHLLFNDRTMVPTLENIKDLWLSSWPHIDSDSLTAELVCKIVVIGEANFLSPTQCSTCIVLYFIVLGHGSSGKTTMVDRILQVPASETRSTIGVDIRSLLR